MLHHCADIGGGLLETRLSFCSKANVLMFTFLQQINTSLDICLRKTTIINTRTGDEQEDRSSLSPKSGPREVTELRLTVDSWKTKTFLCFCDVEFFSQTREVW